MRARPVHVTTLCNDANAAVFAEVIELVMHGLRHAGVEASHAPRAVRADALNLIFAAHRLPPEQVDGLAPDRVIVNLEQVCANDVWPHISPAYPTLLQT